MDKIKDQYFRRNASGVALVEFFWGMGFPVIMESTFLQIFLKHLGASDFLIGMVPAILMVGLSICPLFSSYLTRNREHKRSIVLVLHLISSLATLSFGIFLFYVENTALILPAFFLSYLVFSMCVGLTFPVWLNFLVKIFSSGRSVKGLSIMYAAQNLGKILASIFIIKVVDAFSFSLVSAAWIFFISGILFVVGSFGFLITRETAENENLPPEKDSFFTHIFTNLKEMTGNRNLMKFLAGDLDHYIVLTVIAFYANYATQHFNIPDYTAAGLFVCFIYSGAILAAFFLGTLDIFSLKAKFISTKIINLATLSLLIWFPGFAGFMGASLLLGFSRGTRGIIYSPAVKQFSSRQDATPYFAMAPLLTIGFGSGFPLVFGHVLDRLAHLGPLAYQIMFGVCMGCVAIILIFAWQTNFNPQQKNYPLK